MIKNIVQIALCTVFVLGFCISANASVIESWGSFENSYPYYYFKNMLKMRGSDIQGDLDPLVDLEVTVTIKEIRAFDEIDRHSYPDFYVKVFINDMVFQSPIWRNQKYVTNPGWSATLDVPDEEEFVEIKIQLWDWNLGKDTLCDIAKNDNENPDRHDITLYYSLKTGHWIGDDYYFYYPAYFDLSGYGRGNGCDDNSIYEDDNDCELWFDITFNDYDQDGIPYWTEVNEFGTDPETDDTGLDEDEDGIPIEWEYRWGHYLQYNWYNDTWEHVWFYHPFEWDDHANLDPDNDGLTNMEEYLTSQWGSDPFRKDLFVELDQMEADPNGEKESLLPNGSKNLIRDAFNRQNVVFHLDDGSWADSGSEMIPFDIEGENTTWEELNEIYQEYFLHGDPDNWRRGVFHYGLVVYNASFPGFCFKNNAFQISRKGMEKKTRNPFCGSRDVIYASAYMHELGHTLGLTFLGGHSKKAYYPWQPLWWKYRPYKSVMNYGYMYGIIYNLVDYSDGSRGKNDFDDWGNLDLNYFQEDFW